MKIIVGLGNPGEKYEHTRHNIGFVVIDKTISKFLAQGESASRGQLPISKLNKKFKAEVSEGKINREKVLLVKPQTFMNNSGQSIELITYNLKLKTENLWVVHDDIDLPLGKTRISSGASSAGHKGVQSIIDALKTKDFWRLRIGIGPKVGMAEKFVLKPFRKEEQKVLKEVIERACEALVTALKDPKKAMSLYN